MSGSKELELVAINPEFNRNMFTSLALSSDGRFMIMISEGLGETMKRDRHLMSTYSGAP